MGNTIGAKLLERTADQRDSAPVQKVQIVQGIQIERLEPVAFRLFFTNERAALAAAFFNETDLADRHLAVDGFAHVVDR